MKFHYTQEDIVASLINCGIEKGDNIFIHSNIGFFGVLKDANTPDEYYKIFKDAIFSVIGEEGTLVVPAFSYSFCKGQIFDIEKTPGIGGFFSELLRRDPESKRSEDANFSVACVGKNSLYFTQDVPEYSFGKGSFWEKFLQKNGKFCNFNFDSASTFLHYAERELKVPYRWDKPFKGISNIYGETQERVFYHFVYDLDIKSNYPDFTKFDKKAKETGLVKISNLGKGQVLSITAKDKFDLAESELKLDPEFLIKGNQ